MQETSQLVWLQKESPQGLQDQQGSQQCPPLHPPYLVRVGVASSRVEALSVPLTSWPWEGMTSERVTLVLLVLWALE